MTPILVYLVRFAMVVFGYAVAALVASLFINFVFIGSFEDAVELINGPSGLVVAFFTLFIGYFAFVPAIVAIVAAELLGRRDWLFHALAGAAVSVSATAIYVGTAGWQAGEAEQTDLSLAVIASGVAAGLAYWAIAGRRAGLWRGA